MNNWYNWCKIILVKVLVVRAISGALTAGARCARIKLDTCGALVDLFDIW